MMLLTHDPGAAKQFPSFTLQPCMDEDVYFTKLQIWVSQNSETCLNKLASTIE